MGDDAQTPEQQLRAFRLVAAAVVSLAAISTVFFHYVEHWNWLNSFYFTVVTMGTVGYGDFTPKTDLGKIGAIFLIIFGIGLFATFASLLLKRRSIKDKVRQDKTQDK